MTASVRPPGRRPPLVIRPTRGWRAVDLGEVWRARDLFVTLVSRDVKLRYRQTALGVVWVFLQPLLAAAIFSLIFGRIARLPSHGVPYFLFGYCGYLAWSGFQGTLTRASASLVGQTHLISRVFFPRIILPLSAIGSVLLDTLVGLSLLLVLIPLYHQSLTPALMLFPLWIVLLQMLAVGCGLVGGALAVRYRDVLHILPILVQLLLYASPVGYGLAAVPHSLRSLYALNPLIGALEGFRWSLLGTPPPPAGAVVYTAAMAGAALVCGSLAFTRMERSFADVI